MLLGALRQELPYGVPCEAAGGAARNSAARNLCRFADNTALVAQRGATARRDFAALWDVRKGLTKRLGWEERHPEGPEGHSELARAAGTALRPAAVCLSRTTFSTPHPARFTSPSCSHCLLPARFSRGTSPVFPCLPFWRHPLCELLHLPARTRSLRARSALPLPALSQPGCPY